MKNTLPLILAGACALLVAMPSTSLRAGSAVASDRHGGYGFAHGDYPKDELEAQARARCRKLSEYPDDVRIVFSTRKGGSGVILRYYVEGRAQIVADSGAGEREVYENCLRYVHEHDGRRPEVVERWSDD